MAWLAIAGAVVSAVGAIKKGQADASAARYNEGVAQQNSVVALQQGEAAVQAQNRDARRRLGSMKALYGAAGVEGGTGSPLDVLADSTRMAELDALSTQYNYQLRAQGFNDQAGLDESNARNSSSAAYLNATSSLLNSGAGYLNRSGSTSIPYFG